ncbi:helix-turn-helix domain-containing protein [Kitasatospora aureofaciens]|uniref:helix-turn-helix domain-containing protein n=1 Tax=Kitasatospora aureofaciens TaxID=1894 RepID=UPI003812F953
MTMQQLSANKLAQRSGVNRQVITNVLNGTVWPDLLTIVDLEVTLGVQLWPDHLNWHEGDVPTMRAAPSDHPTE